jgi:hypothetical protein
MIRLPEDFLCPICGKQYYHGCNHVMAEICFYAEKMVNARSSEIIRLRDGIAGILLLSDDYTRNQNERFAMISTRARDLLKVGE